MKRPGALLMGKFLIDPQEDSLQIAVEVWSDPEQESVVKSIGLTYEQAEKLYNRVGKWMLYQRVSEKEKQNGRPAAGGGDKVQDESKE